MKCHYLIFGIALAFVAPSAPRVAVADPVMSELHNPRGIAFAPDGALYVAEAGCGGNTSNEAGEDCVTPAALSSCILVMNNTVCPGLTGSITRLSNGSQERIVTGLPSYGPPAGRNANGPTDVSPVQTGLAYQLYATVGLRSDPANRQLADIGPLFAQLVHIPRSTIVSATSANADVATFTADWLVADIGNYEAQANPDGGNVDTNPYGLLSFRDERIVVDAGGNSLLRVDEFGEIDTLATFPSRAQGRGTDSVPTSVALGPDGAYYVGELTGGQFDDGAANIYRIDPSKTPTVNPTPYLTGFKTVIDIAFDDDGNLYVLQYATGLTGLPANSGVLKRVDLAGCMTLPDVPDGCDRTDVYSGLNGPTSVAIGPDGGIYVTNNGGSPTQGEVLCIEPWEVQVQCGEP